MDTWRLSEISGGIGANIGLHRDSLRMKSPPFAGLSALKKENSLTAGLAGWSERIRTHAFLIELRLYSGTCKFGNASVRVAVYRTIDRLNISAILDIWKL